MAKRKKKRRSATWWLFIGWWWIPVCLVCYIIPKCIISAITKNEETVAAAKTQAPAPKAAPAPVPVPERITPQETTTQPKYEPPAGTTYRVAGISNYTKNVMALACENDDFSMSKSEILECGYEDEKIYKYAFYPIKAEVVPEPENEFDPKAIKVIVDGQHIGYIKKGSCAHLHKVMRENRLGQIRCEMGGGPYKIVDEDGTHRGTAPYWAALKIIEL